MFLKALHFLLGCFIMAGLMAMYFIAFFFDSLDGLI